MVQLDNLIELTVGSAPPKLYRYNRFVSATISAGLADGKTIGQGLDEMDKIAKELSLIHIYIEIKTGEISTYHNKGMHTTTFSEMFPVPGNGYIIDTPGIKGFGDVYKRQVDRNHTSIRIHTDTVQQTYIGFSGADMSQCLVQIHDGHVHTFLRFV